jgi:sec-independent protein translocase protein TatB
MAWHEDPAVMILHLEYGHMLGFSLAELLFIGLIALLLIGPKDMPVAVRSLARVLRTMQGVKRNLQIHIDALVRQADLPSISDAVSNVAAMPGRPNGTVAKDGENVMDGCGTKAATMHSISPTPFRPATFAEEG